MKSKADQKRLDVIHTLPCICCSIAGYKQPSVTEAHHIVDGGYREHSGGHMSTLPLCGWHHRADATNCWSYINNQREMFEMFGPSLKYQGLPNRDNKNGFVKRWGTERELLAKVNELIG